eukprot:TRINITY_DN757_c0_g1_i5.p1 TRINITY_DN757_c0_g1~~TRINITY_DN757_c0_g1_i5.p1  ORF type:complete len:385 (-),score=78.50 TRINITY_DN757_c0_g1_i5:229-1383(-)
MLASRKEVVDEKESDFKDMLDIIRDSCVQFHKTPEMHKQISKRYELKEEDALKWYSDVKITASSFISETALKRTLEALRETGVITAEIADSTLLHNLLDERIASVRKDIKSVKLYQKPELVTYIYNELRHIGKDKGPLGFEEVLPFDQHHYFELDGSEACASAIQLSSGQNVINFGSGLGGVPRYYAGKYGAQVLAVEVQDDLHTTASEITTRCGMSNKVHHLAGDFLLVSKHLRLNFYDSIVSWLTVLHIPQRDSLFQSCFEILKPGGYFFAEDFFEISPFTETEKGILRDDVFCHYLPTKERYTQDLEKAGFVEIKFEDMTKSWTDYTRRRLQNWQTRRADLMSVHGADVVNGLEYFYQRIPQLFEGGNLGGGRIIARKPLQ